MSKTPNRMFDGQSHIQGKVQAFPKKNVIFHVIMRALVLCECGYTIPATHKELCDTFSV